ncbi:hypothetical protein RX06_03086 [Escherichia coli]|nr:hypothetical protein RX06_03086 [Escherichia coli]
MSRLFVFSYNVYELRGMIALLEEVGVYSYPLLSVNSLRHGDRVIFALSSVPPGRWGNHLLMIENVCSVVNTPVMVIAPHLIPEGGYAGGRLWIVSGRRPVSQLLACIQRWKRGFLDSHTVRRRMRASSVDYLAFLHESLDILEGKSPRDTGADKAYYRRCLGLLSRSRFRHWHFIMLTLCGSDEAVRRIFCDIFLLPGMCLFSASAFTVAATPRRASNTVPGSLPFRYRLVPVSTDS